MFRDSALPESFACSVFFARESFRPRAKDSRALVRKSAAIPRRVLLLHRSRLIHQSSSNLQAQEKVAKTHALVCLVFPLPSSNPDPTPVLELAQGKT
jgi:hypothetical protein